MKNVKNKLIYAAIVSAMLLCCSCGRQNAENNDAAGNASHDNGISSGGQSNSDNELPSGNAAGTNGTDAPAEENQQNNETGSANQAGGITIETQTIEDKDTAEDGTLIYVRSYIQPTVTIEGNEAASENINSDIRSRIDSFTASNEMQNEAREYYEISLNDKDYIFNEYSENLDFEAARSDTNVISFIMTVYSYAGGAHGNYGRFGINYNTGSGELIAFDELTEDAGKFYNDTLAFNQALAQTDEYKERMFTEDFLGDGEFEKVLYADEKWYLSNDGLVFISNPYELGPYAAGVIEFVIPYDKLNEMGLKAEYTLPAN